MRPEIAFFTGALLMFGSAFWASVLPINYLMVIVMLSAPSLLVGYYFAPVFTKYIQGLLLGLVAYMAVEYGLYGPVYKVTGLIYAAAYVFAVASVLVARLVYNLISARRASD